MTGDFLFAFLFWLRAQEGAAEAPGMESVGPCGGTRPFPRILTAPIRGARVHEACVRARAPASPPARLDGCFFSHLAFSVAVTARRRRRLLPRTANRRVIDRSIGGLDDCGDADVTTRRALDRSPARARNARRAARAYRCRG